MIQFHFMLRNTQRMSTLSLHHTLREDIMFMTEDGNCLDTEINLFACNVPRNLMKNFISIRHVKHDSSHLYVKLENSLCMFIYIHISPFLLPFQILCFLFPISTVIHMNLSAPAACFGSTSGSGHFLCSCRGRYASAYQFLSSTEWAVCVTCLTASSLVRMIPDAQKQFLVTTSLVFAAVSIASSCPTVCRCGTGIYDITSYHILPGADCSNASLDSIPAGLESTTNSLNLTKNAITVLHNNAFNILGITNLKLLLLDNNNMSVIEKDAFQGLAILHSVSMKNNELSSIHPDVFTYTPLLGTVYLNQNLINNLHPDTFKKNTLLRNLYLTRNRITSIDPFTFRNNPNLWILELSFNKINYFPPELINGSDVRHFDISKNNIASLHPDTFSKNSELLHLDISSNKISNLHPDIFKENKELIHIDISNNNISGTDRKTFRNNKNVQYLNLNGNKIATFHFDTLKNATKLRFLDLGSNDIGYFHSSTFAYNTELRFLDISHNRLISLTHTIFQNNSNLEYVAIKGNSITSIDSELFRNATNLRYLDASINRLSYLLRNTFLTNSELRELNISNNVITSFHPDTLRPVSKLQTFDLSWNGIKYIQPQTFLNNVHLKFLDVSRNQISDIDPHLLLQNPSITQFCVKHNKLNFVNDEPILIAPNLNYLDLGFCNISYLPIKAFQNLTNLKKLYLSNNCLVKLDGLRYEQSLNTPVTHKIFSGPIQLEELDLSNNQFGSLDTNLFDNLQNLRRLDISGNPLECNCNLQNLRSWSLKQHLETGNVLCNDNAKSSWDRVDSLECTSTTTTTTTTSSTSIPQARQMSTKAVKQWIQRSPPTIKYVTAVICTVLVVAVIVPVSIFLWRCYKLKRVSGQSEPASQDNACLIQDDDNFI